MRIARRLVEKMYARERMVMMPSKPENRAISSLTGGVSALYEICAALVLCSSVTAFALNDPANHWATCADRGRAEAVTCFDQAACFGEPCAAVIVQRAQRLTCGYPVAHFFVKHYTNSRIDCVLFLFAASAQHQTRNPDFFAVHATDDARLRTEHVLFAYRLRQQGD